MASPHIARLLKRLQLLLALFAVAAGVTVDALFSGNAGATLQATQFHIYVPFAGGEVARGLRVASTVHGSCWTGSEATPRSDAWRCMTGNNILDPCFSDEQGGPRSFVLCASSPWTSKVTKMVLTKELPYRYGNSPTRFRDPTRFLPWGIKLVSGATCTNLTGATGAIAGMRIGYGCSNGGILVGDAHRSTSIWRIFFAPSWKSKSLRLVGIHEAWW